VTEVSRHRIAVAIIEQEGKFLITQRKSEGTFADLWELPGGKCNDGEDPADCVVREVQEETGLVVAPGVRACVIEHAYSKYIVEIHAYFCRIRQGTPICFASQAFAWIGWDEIEHYRFPAANRLLFARAANLRPKPGVPGELSRGSRVVERPK
jgi:mutator protein MutT